MTGARERAAGRETTMPKRHLTSVLAALVLGIGGSVSMAAEAADMDVAQLETKDEAAPVGGAFVEDFNGDRLSSQWEVLNPDADSFIVEDGALLMVSSAYGKFSKDTVKNLFKLTRETPNGDWVASTHVKLDAQTGYEGFFLLLHDDAQHYVGVGVYTYYSWDRARLEAQTFKRLGEQESDFHRLIWSSDVKSQIFSESARPMPAFVLRLEKRGRSFYAAVKLDGLPDADWIELERLVSLRAKGRISVALLQHKKVKGETVATVDWVRVESTPR